MKALLQKKPSGQDDIHEKNNYKKKNTTHWTFMKELIQQAQQLPPSFLSWCIWSEKDVVSVKQG